MGLSVIVETASITVSVAVFSILLLLHHESDSESELVSSYLFTFTFIHETRTLRGQTGLRNILTCILCTIYCCFLQSVLAFPFVCWYGGLCVKCKNVLDRVVYVGGKTVGETKAEEFDPVV